MAIIRIKIDEDILTEALNCALDEINDHDFAGAMLSVSKVAGLLNDHTEEDN